MRLPAKTKAALITADPHLSAAMVKLVRTMETPGQGVSSAWAEAKRLDALSSNNSLADPVGLGTMV